jgi:hypothetical protein
MSEVPDEMIPQQAKTIGEEPDPPFAGWAAGGDVPTDEDYCPRCGELIECFNQHAGWFDRNSRWHRRCYLLDRGFEEVERGEKYRYEGTIETPNATIKIRVTTATFVMNRKHRWRVDGDLKEEDRSYLQYLTSQDPKTEESRIAAAIMRSEFQEDGEAER